MIGQTPNSDVGELLTLAQEFVRGFNSGDVDRIMRFYADCCVDVNMEQPVQTKAERAEYYQKVITRGDTKVDVLAEEMTVTGELSAGTILLFRVEQGVRKPDPTRLRYVELVRKYPDG